MINEKRTVVPLLLSLLLLLQIQLSKLKWPKIMECHIIEVAVAITLFVLSVIN